MPGINDRKAVFDTYNLTAGKSSLHGRMTVAWGGVRPDIYGTLISARLAPKDFALPNNGDAAAESSAPRSGPRRLFSDAPLGLDGLTSLDAALETKIEELPLGATTLKNISARLTLNDGRLSLSPLKALLGHGDVDGQIVIDGTQIPPHIGMAFKADAVDLSDMLELWGAEAFLSGRADADMNFVSAGESMHALASNLSGSFNLVGAGGDVMTRTANRISSGLADVFTGGSSGEQGMSCLVARFNASNGVVRDNGILVDTSVTTVAGHGSIDLRNETIDMLLRARTNGVDVGGLLPPLKVHGALADPSFTIDANAVVQSVAGLLTTGSLDDGVPDVEAQQGQNACLYTLNHPQASKSPQGGAVQGLAAKAGTAAKQLNQLGGQLMNKLLGQ